MISLPLSPSIQLLYSPLVYAVQVYSSHAAVHGLVYVFSLFLKNSDDGNIIFLNSNELSYTCANQMKNIILKCYLCPLKMYVEIQFTFHIFVSSTSEEAVMLKPGCSFSMFTPPSDILWSLTSASWSNITKQKMYCSFLSWVTCRIFQGCLIDWDIISLYKYESLGPISYFKWQQKLFKCFLFKKDFKSNISIRTRLILSSYWINNISTVIE